ncbi:MAG: hypothetical protein D6818_02515 [Bacteroidetes bacterium]|nr:MAG: hypothetical protein D6818_02515 [Bacteroidota bacterium]
MPSTNPLRDMLMLVPKPLRNRYVWVLVLFVVWMLFFDRRNFIDQWRLSRTIKQLERDKQYYREQIDETKRAQKELEENPEKVARERYYMHKSDEDVFIIRKEGETQQ